MTAFFKTGSAFDSCPVSLDFALQVPAFRAFALLAPHLPRLSRFVFRASPFMDFALHLPRLPHPVFPSSASFALFLPSCLAFPLSRLSPSPWIGYNKRDSFMRD